MTSSGMDAVSLRAWTHARSTFLIAALTVVASAVQAAPQGGQPAVTNTGITATNHGVSLEEERSEAQSAPGESAAPARPPDTPPAEQESGGHESAPAPSPGEPELGGAVIHRGGDAGSPEGAGHIRASGPWYSQGLMPLICVLGAVAGVYYLVRRVMPARQLANSDLLKVVARTSLTQKHSLALIQLARRFILVGISSDRVQTLCELNGPEEVADVAARIGADGLQRAGAFDDLLRREAEDYRSPLEEDPEHERCSASRVAGATRQLTGLLERLRSLQAGN